MTQLTPLAPAPLLPALIAVSDDRAQPCFVEFFAVISAIRTPAAYIRETVEFLGWRAALRGDVAWNGAALSASLF